MNPGGDLESSAAFKSHLGSKVILLPLSYDSDETSAFSLEGEMDSLKGYFILLTSVSGLQTPECCAELR